MNIEALQQKFDELITLLKVYASLTQELDATRIVIEKKSYVNTDREQRLNELEKKLVQHEHDIAAEKRFIEEQGKNSQTTLNKITAEKEALRGLVDEKREFEREKLQFAPDKKEFEEQLIKFQIEREAHMRELKLFKGERIAMIEQTRLMVIKERNIQEKQDRLDRIERMTSS